MTTAVLIGRFQPFHNGHLALLRQALALAPRAVVALGSAYQARSTKNPFNWEERADMIRRALPDADRDRLDFVPVRDHVDDARWIAEVRQAVTSKLPSADEPIVLVGNVRDATRAYLHDFEGWPLHAVPEVPVRRASDLRDSLLDGTAAGIDALADDLPAGTLGFVRDWLSNAPNADLVDALVAESALMRKYAQAWSAAPYPPVLVTVDCVVRCAAHVLLIRRAHAPGKGKLAVPGGFLEQRETTFQGALRELDEETHLDVPATVLKASLRGADVFDQPDRSQRGRTITHGYFFDLGGMPLPAVRADDDAEAVEWTPIASLLSLEDQFLDDHFQMLDHYIGLLPRATGG